MKILFIADFRRDHPRFMLNNPRMFSKGLVRNGHDVLEFSYKDQLMGNSPFRSKGFSLWYGKKKTDNSLLKLARHYQPDVLLITTFKLFDTHILKRLKESLPRAVIVCWYGDMNDGVDPSVAKIGRECDWFLSTSGGELLRQYKQAGIPHCAFLPNPCDADIQFPQTVPDKFRSDILFTGKLAHGKAGQDTMRRRLIEELTLKKGMTVWGCLGRPKVEGIDYLRAIQGAKIALSINAYNEVRFYHSDRLTHYLACGSFTLVKYVPGSELLFEDGRHLRYFRTMEECFDLIDYYLAHDSLRTKIAGQGYEHIHRNYNGQTLSKYIIDLVQTGGYDPLWGEIA